MRDGQWIATRPAKELTMNEIIRLMVGRELTNRFPAKDYQVGSDVVLKVEASRPCTPASRTCLSNSGKARFWRSRSGWLRTHRAFGKHLWQRHAQKRQAVDERKAIHNHSPKDSIRNGFAW